MFCRTCTNDPDFETGPSLARDASFVSRDRRGVGVYPCWSARSRRRPSAFATPSRHTDSSIGIPPTKSSAVCIDRPTTPAIWLALAPCRARDATASSTRRLCRCASSRASCIARAAARAAATASASTRTMRGASSELRLKVHPRVQPGGKSEAGGNSCGRSWESMPQRYAARNCARLRGAHDLGRYPRYPVGRGMKHSRPVRAPPHVRACVSLASAPHRAAFRRLPPRPCSCAGRRPRV